MRVPTQKSFIEQQLPVFPESDNTRCKKAVAVYRDGSVVGHAHAQYTHTFMYTQLHESIFCITYFW